jgi:hypothetical protein
VAGAPGPVAPRPIADTVRPSLSLSLALPRPATLRRYRTVSVRVTVNEAANVVIEAVVDRRDRKRRLRTVARAGTLRTRFARSGSRRLTWRLSRAAVAALSARSGRLRLQARATDRAGNVTVRAVTGALARAGPR